MRVQSIGDYYTLQGAAEALGVSYWQVWRAVRHQQTPTLLLGQTRLVLLEDVQAAMPEREQPNPEPAEQRPAAARQPEPPRPVSPVVSLGQVCPQCESRALVYEEGCQKCHACGYALC